MHVKFLGAGVALIMAATAGESAQGSSANQVAQSIRQAWDDAKRNITESGDLMPDEHYGFQPTKDVRTFGQILAHIDSIVVTDHIVVPRTTRSRYPYNATGRLFVAHFHDNADISRPAVLREGRAPCGASCMRGARGAMAISPETVTTPVTRRPGVGTCVVSGRLGHPCPRGPRAACFREPGGLAPRAARAPRVARAIWAAESAREVPRAGRPGAGHTRRRRARRRT